MEILAVGFLYDNETTTLRVSVYVGIPEINGETYSAPTFRKQSLSATSPPSNPMVEKFTNFEFYLTALPNGISSEPPSNCLNDNFLQHSSRNVMVGCPLTRGPSRYEKHNVDDNQTSCVGRDVVMCYKNSAFQTKSLLTFLFESFRGILQLPLTMSILHTTAF